MRKLIASLVAATLLPALALRAQEAPATPQDDQPKVEELEKRIQKLERDAALDRVKFTGDYRFEAHSIDASVPSHFDGLALQNQVVNTLFYAQSTGQFPPGTAAVGDFIRSHYADYLYFTQNLTFDQLKQAIGQFPPQAQQQLYGLLLPGVQVPGYAADNSILYTNRLRLRMEAEVAKNVSFSGRLGMYKVFGDSTGVQVLNGQPTSVNIDGTTTGVPNSDILRVERAYFSWNKIGGSPLYLSIGRRPSTEGAPLTLRNDEPRGGTPLGALINYQFDGITVGYGVGEHSTARICYGLGYESGFGNGDILKLPQDRLKDAHFIGLNWDLIDTDNDFVQVTLARAIDVTDGFNGLVVLPNDPVTGAPVPAPIVMRFTPSTNLGDLDLGSIIAMRKQGPFDVFAAFSFNRSNPDPVTTPFGGFFSDPFETPEEQTGTMWYVGGRYSFNQNKTKLGLEYNHGSQYWLNFAVAEDDIVAPKTATRGDVVEAYLTHRITPRFVVKAAYIKYWYDYSLSGWQVGAPKPLDQNPILGLPTYDKAGKFSIAMTARF
ncbi:MAG: DUF3373 family protein [Vicinamibacteria bacterium]